MKLYKYKFTPLYIPRFVVREISSKGSRWLEQTACENMVIHHLQCLCKGSWILGQISTDFLYLANTHTHGNASYMKEYLTLFW
jgi:hypothetical protein